MTIKCYMGGGGYVLPSNISTLSQHVRSPEKTVVDI